MLYQSVEDANKTLAAELRRRCDMATQSTCTALAGHCWEGYWDGHKAYRLLSRHLFGGTAKKALYLAALLEAQEKHHLPPA